MIFDNKVAFQSVMAELAKEAGGYGFVAFAPWNGQIRGMVSPDPTGALARPDQERQDLTIRLCQRLNRELPDGGYWITAWFGDQRWGMAWLDPQHDIQFWVENDEAWVRCRQATDEHWLADADTAWRKAFVIKSQILGVRADQQYQRSMGQRNPEGLT